MNYPMPNQRPALDCSMTRGLNAEHRWLAASEASGARASTVIPIYACGAGPLLRTVRRGRVL
jgi:hypothetical protein